jgi:hypothetical protein
MDLPVILVPYDVYNDREGGNIASIWEERGECEKRPAGEKILFPNRLTFWKG